MRQQSLGRGFVFALLAGAAALVATSSMHQASDVVPLSLGRRLAVAALAVFVVLAGDLAGWRLVSLAEDVGERFDSPLAQSAARISAYLVLAAVFCAVLFALAWALGMR